MPPSPKPHVPPRDLFERLRQNLNQEADAIRRQPYLSTRQKLDRYLKHVKESDAVWLVQMATRRKATASPATARDRIYDLIDQILRTVTYTTSLSAVSVPPGVVPAGLTVDGNIAPPEYPDRPPEVDESDPRLLAQRLAEWEEQVAECVRQDAPAGKAAEEIYRPHGVFEQAMPPDRVLERIYFRAEGEYIERTLRHDLMSCGERLLLDDAPAPSQPQPMPKPQHRPGGSRRAERGGPIKRGRPLQRKRTAAQIRRSREVHAECDPALDLLGWSGHDWADATKGKVSHSAIDRILSGETARIRNTTRKHLFHAMEEELTNRKRTDLLMTSPRWRGAVSLSSPTPQTP